MKAAVQQKVGNNIRAGTPLECRLAAFAVMVHTALLKLTVKITYRTASNRAPRGEIVRGRGTGHNSHATPADVNNPRTNGNQPTTGDGAR